jgi:hypothetical protein
MADPQNRDEDRIGSGAGDTKALATGAERDSDGAAREDLGAVEPALAEAVESGTGSNASAPRVTGGKLSSEGTGAEAAAPDAGSPGGMGGAGARSRTADDRPPGGVSPLGKDEKESGR